MKVTFCTQRDILHPSTLLDFRYQIGPYYGCEHNCRYCYIHDRAETDPSKEVLIHQSFAEQLERELRRIEPQTVFIGMDTDPYQPIEEEHRHTRQALELLMQRGCSACILTRSDLVVRDADLLAEMPGSSVGISVAFQREDVRAKFEEKAPSTQRRIDGLMRIQEAGIESYALISPVMPLITDVDALIDMLAPHADTIWVYRLSMESEGDISWQNTRAILSDHFPDLASEFKEITFAPRHRYWTALERRLREIQQGRRLNLKLFL